MSGAERLVHVRTSRGLRYRIAIGPGELERLSRDLMSRRLGDPARIVVIADRRVARLHAPTLLRALARGGLSCDLLTFPPGEASKTRETKARLEDALVRRGFGRGTVIALGGGVTGDLAGFVAATWHRGIGLIQAPTTVLAMLDASIGGKVGVDHPAAKNLIGAYHPPLAVYADTRTLATLPARDRRAGLAEAVKCAAIGSAAAFRALEGEADQLRAGSLGALTRTIRAAARFKARIVSRDEREAGPRALLNFGHTLGHALEAASGYRLRHGEAVAIGIRLESRLAARLGLLRARDAARIEALLDALALPLASEGRAPSARSVLRAVGRDKKRGAGDGIRFALPSAIGRHAGGRGFLVEAKAADLRAVLATLSGTGD